MNTIWKPKTWITIFLGIFIQSFAFLYLNRASLFFIYLAIEELRRLVFHDDAWHWAMLKIKGEHYWKHYPELADATHEYEEEWKKYDEIKLRPE